MQKRRQHNFWIAVYAILFIGAVLLSSMFSYRIDLTAEKRHSVTDATKTLLKNIDSVVTIQVFLTGDLPADYKKLSNATRDLLDEFKSLSGNLVRVKFEKPGENISNDTAKVMFYDSLARLGVVFERSETVSSASEKQTNQLIIPSALVTFRHGQKPILVDLRSSRKIYKQFDVINDNTQEDVEATRNAAEALLEYKFANAIDKLTRKYVPTVAYAVGNGEPIDLKVNDLGESLRGEYRLAVFDLKKAYPDASVIDALMIVKPTQPFTDEDKLKIDQYVMNGGHVIWFVDKLHAELDSLMRSQAEYTAFDRGLELDDILFRYGVRINPDLVQDLNCAKLPMVTGKNPDGSPIINRAIPWPYYPFLSARSDNPISKNLERVLPVFPSSIDTVRAQGISKTILLATDSNSRRLSSPAIVSANSVKDEQDLASFNKSYIPIAVLLEGKFRSLFANRLGKEVLDSVQRVTGRAYLAGAAKEGKQIVVGDADIVTNAVSGTTGPLPMGELPFENYRFANREFFLNSVDYLVSTSQLFKSRNKDFVLRLLDKRKVSEQRGLWQMINIVLPLLLLIITGAILQWLRKRRYS